MNKFTNADQNIEKAVPIPTLNVGLGLVKGTEINVGIFQLISTILALSVKVY